MNILTASDSRYLKPTMTMLESLFCHSSEDVIVILMHTSISVGKISKLRQYISRWGHQNGNRRRHKLIEIKLSEDFFERFPMRLEHTSKETYYRLRMCHILPENIDRVLYLDGDIIVQKDITKFYRSDFNGKAAIACKDYHVQRQYDNTKRIGLKKRQDYFNAGVMLINIPALKIVLTDKRIEQVLEKRINLLFQDQDILNIVLDGHIRYARTVKFNYMVDMVKLLNQNGGRIQKPYIIHYAGCDGVKPWRYNCTHDYDRVYWLYAKQIWGVHRYYMYCILNRIYRKILMR